MYETGQCDNFAGAADNINQLGTRRRMNGAQRDQTCPATAWQMVVCKRCSAPGFSQTTTEILKSVLPGSPLFEIFLLAEFNEERGCFGASHNCPEASRRGEIPPIPPKSRILQPNISPLFADRQDVHPASCGIIVPVSLYILDVAEKNGVQKLAWKVGDMNKGISTTFERNDDSQMLSDLFL